MTSTAFVDRQACGLRPPLDGYPYLRIPAEGVTAHYAGPSPWGGAGAWNHDRCASIWRAFQAYHMDQNGWMDIAYTSGVCPHGTRYEGRPIWARTAAQGTEDGNTRSLAVCYIAGEGDPLTDEAKAGFLDEAFRLDKPLRWVHSDWHPTGCPGDPIRAWKDALWAPPSGYQAAPATPPVLPPSVVVIDPVASVPRLVEGRPAGGWEFNRHGQVYAFDGAPYFGGWGPESHQGECVALVPSLTGSGYTLVDAGGECFSYGDAKYPGNYRADLWGPGVVVGAFVNGRVAMVGGVTLVRTDANLYRLPA